MTESGIAQNLKDIRAKIETAAKAHDREARTVNLVAVSKKQPQDKIQAALDAGQRVFGENRVQEAYDHWAEIKRSNRYPDLRLHLIGPLQTNKVSEAVSLFDCIETLDRDKLARKLSAEMEKQGKTLPCFIQVNTGEEEQKSGVLPAQLDEFYNFCTKDCGLNVTGLMCIPPFNDPPAVHFAFLHKLARRYHLPDLSMGMSADYEKAIPLGATYVRVGTGIFGERREG